MCLRKVRPLILGYAGIVCILTGGLIVAFGLWVGTCSISSLNGKGYFCEDKEDDMVLYIYIVLKGSIILGTRYNTKYNKNPVLKGYVSFLFNTVPLNAACMYIY